MSFSHTRISCHDSDNNGSWWWNHASSYMHISQILLHIRWRCMQHHCQWTVLRWGWGRWRKFLTTVLIELRDSLTCLVHSSVICPWWWALPPLLSYTPTLSNEAGLWQQCQCYCLVSGPKNSTPLPDVMTVFLMPASQSSNEFMSWLLAVQRYGS